MGRPAVTPVAAAPPKCGIGDCRVVPPSPYPPYSPVFPRLVLGLIMTADVVVSHCRNPAIFVRF